MMQWMSKVRILVFFNVAFLVNFKSCTFKVNTPNVSNHIILIPHEMKSTKV